MENNPFLEVKKAKSTNIFVRILQIVAVFAVIFLLAYVTILGQNEVRGPSMQPNFHTSEALLINRLPQILGSSTSEAVGMEYKRGDVVVVSIPGQEEFVKRIIGMPGENVSIKDGYIYVNGERLIEEYISDEVYTAPGTNVTNIPVKIPADSYFVVGDNRPCSNDSRSKDIGFIKYGLIKGKVFLRVSPSNKFGLIGTGNVVLVKDSASLRPHYNIGTTFSCN